MNIKSPKFWNKKGFYSNLLFPLSYIWVISGIIKSLLTRTAKTSLPVLCIGNITIGGSGKTPLSITISNMLKEKGYKTCILTRGYKGKISGPLFVNKGNYNSFEIGDEALILSKNDLVCVSKNRFLGANFIKNNSDTSIIIMDDGMQNYQLSKDLTIGIFDGKNGIQNGRIIPSGPLRENLNKGLKKIDIFIINGRDKSNIKDLIPKNKPCYEGNLIPSSKKLNKLKNKQFVAFSGINDPDKFFNTLENNKINLTEKISFPDHYEFSEVDLTQIKTKAKIRGCSLITTEKDWVRLPQKWKKNIHYLEVFFQINKNFEKDLMQKIISKLSERVK